MHGHNESDMLAQQTITAGRHLVHAVLRDEVKEVRRQLALLVLRRGLLRELVQLVDQVVIRGCRGQ